MRLLIAILIFYKKLVLPSVLLSTLLAFSIRYVGAMLPSLPEDDILPLFSAKTFAFAYICFSLVFQFFIYEIRYSNEYYFYYNMGINKLSLWISNILISCTISFGLLLL